MDADDLKSEQITTIMVDIAEIKTLLHVSLQHHDSRIIKTESDIQNLYRIASESQAERAKLNAEVRDLVTKTTGVAVRTFAIISPCIAALALIISLLADTGH